MQSVRAWAEGLSYAYRIADDADLLAELPPWFQKKVGKQWQILSDLGRLQLTKQCLERGHQRVIWLDADVLIFRSNDCALPPHLPDGYGFGRELWLEGNGRLRNGVHNALCIFEQGNPFLDFYIHACLRIIEQFSGSHITPQLLGPKFLKSQHSLLNFALSDAVAMFSPTTVSAILHNDTATLHLLKDHAQSPAANLCLSLLDEATALQCVERLLEHPFLVKC